MTELENAARALAVVKTIHAGVNQTADFDHAVYISVVEYFGTGVDGMKSTETAMCPERALYLATQLIRAAGEVFATKKRERHE